MDARDWVEVRAVELLACLVAVGLLVTGLAAGLPFLRARIAEVFLYSLCCLSAVILHALADLSVRAIRGLTWALTRRVPPAAVQPALEPATA